ncbi:MAG: hypothetical protein NUW37_10695 [Planctomycetes bacterium]|nr:hypothetical protein [Planctomycetota bacterium]
MAIRRVTRIELGQAEKRLVKALIREIDRDENEESPKGAPIIVCEETLSYRGQSGDHYFVVWNKFEGMDDDLRNLIVWEALSNSKTLDEDELSNVVVAMGVTTEEAEEMGLEI